MKISELKLDYIRTTFQVDINGDLNEVNVFNLIGDKRKEILDTMINYQESGLSTEEMVENLYTDIFFECTDLELDDNIVEIINNPKMDMLMILSEVNEIIHELQCETMLSKIAEINQMEKLSYTNLMLAKTQNATRNLEKIKKLSPGENNDLR